ncbi:hypothetical protein QYF61_015173 [Mycteria americana]|uniref:Uncharacterized protein n=1 Tax=Mycteria americana TaxID=33587 RepID=A0AAN7RVS8_MYCAM|nr:hypothetical protein QYF61_015170 [Mycteria americana]KAK4822424.1 hypothetical protein QYF61_015171 [Mycteria americana]KAK4822426.1 hypothetical protein QYF61_015173 [Mycteria americana]
MLENRARKYAFTITNKVLHKSCFGYGWLSGLRAHIAGSRLALLNPFFRQPVLIPGLAPTQVQDLALGLVEPHEVRMGPLLELVQVPVNGIPSLRRVSRTTQVGVICKLAEGALDPSVYVVDEDIKQCCSQYGPLRDTTRH